MKSKYSRILTGTSIAILACTALMELASAKADRLSGNITDFVIWVECLDDYIVLDWEFNRVRIPHADGMTYSNRQKGVGEDSNGNTWKFSGHYQFTTKYSDNLTVEHWIDRNILISQQRDLPNLQLMTTGNFVTANGDLAAEIFVESVSCIAR